MIKKILYITPEFPPQLGGVATISYDFVKLYRELGYKVDIITIGQHKINNVYTISAQPQNLLERLIISIATKFRCKVFTLWLIQAFKTFILAFYLHLRNKYDVIETHDYYAASYFVNFFKPIFKIFHNFLFITRISGPLKVLSQYYYFEHSFEKKLLNNIEIGNITLADRLSYPSTKMLKEISKYTKLPKAIKVIPPFEQVSNKCKKDVKDFAYVGRIQDGKGVEEIISAWLKASPIFRKEHNLNLFGSDTVCSTSQSFKEYLFNKYSLNKEPSIKFEGPLPHEDILKKLTEIRCLVFTPKMENYPTILIEAIQNNMQIITNTTTGAIEVIEDFGYPNAIECNTELELIAAFEKAITLNNIDFDFDAKSFRKKQAQSIIQLFAQ